MKKLYKVIVLSLSVFLVGCDEEHHISVVHKTYPNADIAKIPDSPNIFIVRENNQVFYVKTSIFGDTPSRKINLFPRENNLPAVEVGASQDGNK